MGHLFLKLKCSYFELQLASAFFYKPSQFYYHTLFISELNKRTPETYSPVHIINIDVQDNHDEATVGAFQICDLCEKVSEN